MIYYFSLNNRLNILRNLEGIKVKGVIFSSMAPLTQPEEWFSNLSNQFQTLEMVRLIALEPTTNRAGNQESG